MNSVSKRSPTTLAHGTQRPASALPDVTKARIQELDGLRALAVVMVVVSHGAFKTKITSVPFWEYATLYVFHGDQGVQLFFVISGFIITRLLVEESRKRGRIDLRSFYVRRFAKLMPPVLALIPCVFLYEKVLGGPPIYGACYVAAVTFTVGLFSGCNWNMAHLWSLTLEEIFYLAWPFVLLYAGYSRAKLWWILPVAGLGVASRVIMFLGGPATAWYAVFKTLQYLDHMAVGAGLAIWMARTTKESAVRSALSHPAALAVGIGVAMVLTYFGQYRPIAALTLVAPFLKGCAFALLVLNVLDRTSFLSRFFGSKLIAYVGLCSYSTYLFQQLMFGHPTVKAWLGSNNWAVVVYSVFVLGVGIVIFNLVERPAQSWLRARLARFL